MMDQYIPDAYAVYYLGLIANTFAKIKVLYTDCSLMD